MSAATSQKVLPKESIVRAGGLTLSLNIWHEERSARPLLFLNGIGADAAAAAPLLRRIAGRPIWTIDMPGTGKSPDCFFPYSAQSMAETIMKAVRQHHDGPIDLAGFSWGGALAQQITGQFPESIASLILLATSSEIGAADIGWGAAMDRDIQNNGLRMPVISPLGLTYQSLAMLGWSGASLQSRITQRPMLVLSGARDQVIRPAECQRLADALGGIEHKIIEGGHLFPFTKAEETAAIISEFLDHALVSAA